MIVSSASFRHGEVKMSVSSLVSFRTNHRDQGTPLPAAPLHYCGGSVGPASQVHEGSKRGDRGD